MAVYFDQKETGMIKIDDVKGAMTGAPGEHYMAIQENFIAEKFSPINVSDSCARFSLLAIGAPRLGVGSPQPALCVEGRTSSF